MRSTGYTVLREIKYPSLYLSLLIYFWAYSNKA